MSLLPGFSSSEDEEEILDLDGNKENLSDLLTPTSPKTKKGHGRSTYDPDGYRKTAFKNNSPKPEKTPKVKRPVGRPKLYPDGFKEHQAKLREEKKELKAKKADEQEAAAETEEEDSVR